MEYDPFRSALGGLPGATVRPAHAALRTTQSVRPGNASAPKRWLATLPATLDAVRQATLATLTELKAQLAYLYHADDKVVVRSTLGDRQIRAEMTPIDEDHTRIVVVTVRDGEVDRAVSTRIVQAVEVRLGETAAGA